MTVALTIGLSVATRTIMNIRTSTDEESSQRSFSAAEAGMEKALQELNAGSGSLTNNSTYQTTIASLSGTEIILNNGAPVLKDAPTDLWLSTYPNYSSPWTGIVTVYWGSSQDACDTDEATNSLAALEIVLITGIKANPVVYHFPVDACNARSAINNFEYIAASGKTFQGKTFTYKKTIPVTSGLLMRIVPVYASTLIGVQACDGAGNNCKALPAQGTIITSTGTANSTQTKIIAFKENPRIPVQLFPFIIFSPK